MGNYESIRNLMINMNPAAYIDLANLATQQIEVEFARTTLDVTGKKRHYFVENNLNPPSFIVIFYYYIYYHQRIPSQQEFLTFYFLINKDWIYQNVKPELMDAFEGRLSRTFPSLVRDVHCHSLLKEKTTFKRVIYNMKYDLSGKVDLFVESKNNNWYGLQLRVATKNSNTFYQKKPFRNAIEIPGLKKIIDMPLNLDGAKSIFTQKNDLKVYSDREVAWLCRLINEIETVNFSY
ncbi:hypothetical protein QE429_003861 [Bacillus sp. SORGH_AS 510]|uniref:hypothetical protein n=1 Tax=Bacillus sp. SORGH_AS_0510 TaxID=3041771 RepID=UPI00277FCB40|nr:hypothetical protein [Bacillus sp. SORGH_AS_0510]MDQ1147034.1 hypothetical protein [Bacillus sp. SORGH_AS_0510]